MVSSNPHTKDGILSFDVNSHSLRMELLSYISSYTNIVHTLSTTLLQCIVVDVPEVCMWNEHMQNILQSIGQRLHSHSRYVDIKYVSQLETWLVGLFPFPISIPYSKFQFQFHPTTESFFPLFLHSPPLENSDSPAPAPFTLTRYESDSEQSIGEFHTEGRRTPHTIHSSSSQSTFYSY